MGNWWGGKRESAINPDSWHGKEAGLITSSGRERGESQGVAAWDVLGSADRPEWMWKTRAQEALERDF